MSGDRGLRDEIRGADLERLDADVRRYGLDRLVDIRFADDEERAERRMATQCGRSGRCAQAATNVMWAQPLVNRLIRAVAAASINVEHDHDIAQHPQPDELISDRACRTCAQWDEVWVAMRALASTGFGRR